MRAPRMTFAAALVFLASPVAAHHSPAAFDLRSTVDVRGEVVRFDWKNPHVYIVIDGTDASGRRGEWLVEGSPTPLMMRNGWTASTLRPGDVVSLEVRPDRDPGKQHGLLVALTTADGTRLGPRTVPVAPSAAATDIAGVWDALRNFSAPFLDQDVDPVRRYTQAALVARARYTAEQYPPAACLAFPTPMLTVLPYLSEIQILDDRVLISSEFYDVVRTIYTDGRNHPPDAPRTVQGHSIGRWEGRTFAVDTRQFADYRLGHGPGVPSGAQKHTVERFALSADGTELDIEITVDDPEFVAEPYTIRTTWDFAPGQQPVPFECDPDNASAFYER